MTPKDSEIFLQVSGVSVKAKPPSVLRHLVLVHSQITRHGCTTGWLSATFRDPGQLLGSALGDLAAAFDEADGEGDGSSASQISNAVL